MKKRTTQLLSLMISAAMIASTPCLTYAADFSSETLLSDSEESSEDFSEEIPSTDPSSSEQSPATADADSTSESTSIPDDASSSDEITLSDNDVNSESILSEDAEELSESPSEDFSESTDEDEELFMDDQDPDFSDGNSDGQELGGAVDSNEYHTLSASANNISDNRYAQNYINYSNVICSNLMADGNGYIRVEADDSGLLIQQFNPSFQLSSTRSITNELPLFGGFYAGANNYYVVFGQTNPDENDNTEVFRLVKYDKSWNRLGSVSLYGANTYVPFDAGSLRMYEYNNYLFIRTCHTMYASSDGFHHQANVTWQIDTSSMSTVDSYYGIMNIGIGYASHSFNQFIQVDDAGNIVALDHGDAYPRSAVLGKYRQKAGADGFLGTYYSTSALSFQGGCGVNYTGASLGGLEYSDSSYLVAGNSVPQDSGWADHPVRNIFVSTTPKTTSSSLSSSLKWITSYSQDGGTTTSTPQLVKLGSNAFLLLWGTKTVGASWYAEKTNKISYVFLDGNGNMTSQIYSQTGILSDCKPAVFNGKATWYVTDGSKLTFYQVNSDGSFSSEIGHMNTWKPELNFSRSSITAGLIEKTASNPLTAKTDGIITYTSSDPSVATVDQNGTLSFKGIGTCTITANATSGSDYVAGSASYTLNVIDLKTQSINVKNSFSCTYRGKSFSLNASAKTALKYANQNKDIVTVSASGVVTPKKAGTARIVITATRTDSYIGASKTVTVTVNPKSIQNCRLFFTKLGSVDFDFSEAEKNLAVADGERILKKNTDYSIGSGYMSGNSYELYVSFYIIGNGNYTGSLNLSASTISTRSALLSAASTSKGIKLTWETEGGLGYYIYRKAGNGKYSMVKKITKASTGSWVDTDSAKNPGFYTYAIKAYTKNGNKTLCAQLSNTKTAGSVPLILSASRKGKIVRLTYKRSAGTSGYTIYRLQGKTWKAIGNTKNTTYTDKKPGTATKYRIRAYHITNGKKIYGPYSSVRTVK